MSKKQFLSTQEIAKTLDVTDATVRNLIRRGELPANKIGMRVWRVRKTDFEHFLDRTSTVTITGGKPNEEP